MVSAYIRTRHIQRRSGCLLTCCFATKLPSRYLPFKLISYLPEMCLAAWLACSAHPTRLSILCHGRCSHTCRPVNTHRDRQQRRTTSLDQNNGHPSCQAGDSWRKTKRVFLDPVRHQSWLGRFRRHRNTLQSARWHWPQMQVAERGRKTYKEQGRCTFAMACGHARCECTVELRYAQRGALNLIAIPFTKRAE